LWTDAGAAALGGQGPVGHGLDPGPTTKKCHSGLLALLLSCTLPAAAAQLSARSLADMSFDELADIEITSVSKKAESLGGAAASIYVITADDIRRYGANTLPETLRLAPNLHVARLNAQQYAISARGFNNSTGNKLLVLIDGRIVYTPLYSGVFWDAHDVPLEDVERIEVISGPGGTLWGTNAVNGVINIITRAAADTQGTRLAAGSGNQETALGLRHGERFAPKAHYRAYAKVIDRDATARADSQAVRDAWRRAQAGFRVDWAQAQDRFTVQGDTYSGDLDRPDALAAIRGTNLLAHWQRALPQGGGLNLLAYFDRTERDFPGVYRETTDISNVELQHTLAPVGVHALTWGGSARQGHDHEENGTALAFLPAHLDQYWFSLFGQDEIAWHDDWRLILGARLEHNDYTGHEFLPNVRLAWQPTETHLLWGAVSRVVRAPSRIDRDFHIPAQPPFLLAGNTTFASETAHVHELGYRTQATATTSYSVTLFHTLYDDLRTVELAPSGSFVIGNGMEGSTNGVEAWGRWQVTPRWRLSAGVTALEKRLRLKPGSINPGGTSSEGNDPEQTLQLRSLLNLSARHELDVTLRHVADLPNPAVPAHTALDAHWGWKLRPGLELAVVGQNLGDRRQPEFGRASTRSEIPASFLVSLSWQR
jgi:iron complex outermembrane receptor protein